MLLFLAEFYRNVYRPITTSHFDVILLRVTVSITDARYWYRTSVRLSIQCRHGVEMIARFLGFSNQNVVTKFQGYNIFNWSVNYSEDRKYFVFRFKSPLISETVRDRHLITIDHYQEIFGSWSICETFDDLEWHWTAGRERRDFSDLCTYARTMRPTAISSTC